MRCVLNYRPSASDPLIGSSSNPRVYNSYIVNNLEARIQQRALVWRRSRHLRNMKIQLHQMNGQMNLLDHRLRHQHDKDAKWHAKWDDHS